MNLNFTVYVLTLSRGRFYVGSTSDLKRRVSDHESSKTSVKRYLPIKQVDVAHEGLTKEQARHLETIVTEDFMIVHGIENVRGGPYLSDESTVGLTIESLKRRSNHHRELCYLCECSDHYASRCPGRRCTRCGMTGHGSFTCYHNRPVDEVKPVNITPPPAPVCTRCDRIGHWEIMCAYKTKPI